MDSSLTPMQKCIKVLVSSNPTHRDGSFEHQKHMFKLMGKNIITVLFS